MPDQTMPVVTEVRENLFSRQPLETVGSTRFLRSVDPTMRLVEEQATEVAASNETVLLLGETGVGKDMLARTIHEASPRSAKPFVHINCAAMPHELLESELFGHVRGAYTGAVSSQAGQFQTASGGTLFLNEISETTLQFQAKLLHVLEEKSFYPVGGRKPVQADVRVIAASNRDMEKEIAAGTFRRDLYHRLCVVYLKIPPLRARGVDIERLARFFARKYASLYNRPALAHLSTDIVEAMKRYSFEGNVRELDNLVKRAVLLGGYDRILRDLEQSAGPDPVGAAVAPAPVKQVKMPAAEFMPLKELVRQTVERTEREAISRALTLMGWNRRKTARYLKISYRSLLYKIQEYAIDPAVPESSPNELSH